MDYKCKGRQCVQTTNIRGGMSVDYKCKGRQFVQTINVIEVCVD